MRTRTQGTATIVASISMSVDRFMAGPSDEVDRLFAWYATLNEASGACLQESTVAAPTGRRSTRSSTRLSWVML